MRQLDSQRYMAQTVHFCDNCCHDILPGDIYERNVYLTDNKIYRVSIEKRHIDPDCPVDPFIEEQEMLMRAEREAKEEPVRLREAA